MINFIESLQQYCEAAGLVYTEGICDAGTLGDDGVVKVIPNGGYQASISLNGVQEVHGFYPIPAENNITEQIKDGAHRSLLYSLIAKATRP